MSTALLSKLLADAAARYPERVAVADPQGASITYSELWALSGRFRDFLAAQGVGRSDRVGLFLPKSIDSIITIVGTLRAGSAYVPVDPDAPAARCAYILHDCAVRVIVTVKRLEAELRAELEARGASPVILVLDEADRPVPMAVALPDAASGGAADFAEVTPEDLAYVLYTSGSTGNPKGVMLTHGNAMSFVNWCNDLYDPQPDDVFSSHAPLHFDLSILDLYVSLGSGARLELIDEALGKDPRKLAAFIAERRITMWYSTPSILSLLVSYGRLHEHDYSALRVVNFAGEVFPIPQLRALKAVWQGPKYYNLYGPTETNVCTWYEIPEEIAEDRTEPFPIGYVCEPNEGLLVDGDGKVVPDGEHGELVITGPNVMQGYWNLPERSAQAFFQIDGKRWYRTGDIVSETDGLYIYRGRRDRMVKRRGYRVELGEIEVGLAQHPDLREVAAVAVPTNDGIRIHAIVSPRTETAPSIIDLKQFCSTKLPRYMIPDTFAVMRSLPRTSTDKVDYRALQAMA